MARMSDKIHWDGCLSVVRVVRRWGWVESSSTNDWPKRRLASYLSIYLSIYPSIYTSIYISIISQVWKNIFVHRLRPKYHYQEYFKYWRKLMLVHISLFLNIMLPGRLCKLCGAMWCTNFLTAVWGEFPRKVVNTICFEMCHGLGCTLPQVL